jgi:hypothetical protein
MGKRPRQHRDPNGSTKNQKTRGVLDIPILDTTAQKAAAHSGSTNEITVADEAFDLERFERYVYSRYKPDIETAFGMLVAMLRQMQLSRGDVPQGILCSRISQTLPEMERVSVLWTRVSTAILTLFLNPAFEALSADGFFQLLTLKPQLITVFQAGVINNADACIEAFNLTPDSEAFSMPMDDLYKVLLLYSLDSRYEPKLIYGFASQDRAAVIDTCIALCSSIFCGTELAYRRRNDMQRYLCEQLPSHQLSERSLLDASSSVYMHCSYADGPDKHAIKGLLHQQWRRLLAEHGIRDLCEAREVQKASAPGSISDEPTPKPTVLILHEWLRSGCAMHRCYANWIAALREQFHTVGMGLKEATAMDPEAIALFDHYEPLPEGVSCIDQVRSVHAWCRKHHPAIVYYPSIGMGVHTVAAASIRLAPLQVMTGGHPASSYSPVIDRIVLPEPREAPQRLLLRESIHENIAWIPWQSLTFAHVQTADEESIRKQRDAWHARQVHLDYQVQIAISSSPMKLTNEFLEFLVSIERSSERKAGFHFFLADSRGALHLEIRAAIMNRLRNANVYPHLDYQDYLGALRVADVFVTPFPFGNSNTHIDYYRSGILGTCMQGREICSLYDASLLTWLRHPKDLIAENKEAYKQIVLRLINDQQWRGDIYDQVYGDTYEDINAMNGDASLFCEYGFYR